MNTAASISPGRILLVDDDRTYREAIGLLLQDAGYHTQGVSNGDECLSFAALWKPDLILLDVSMPGKNSFETYVELKEHDELTAIPVLFMTSHDDPDSISCAFELGAQDYITKPPHKAVLLARVRAHMMRQRDHDVHLHQIREQLRQIERECLHAAAQLDVLASDATNKEASKRVEMVRDYFTGICRRLSEQNGILSPSPTSPRRYSTLRDLQCALGECFGHPALRQKGISFTTLGEVPEGLLDMRPDELCPALNASLQSFLFNLPGGARCVVGFQRRAHEWHVDVKSDATHAHGKVSLPARVADEAELKSSAGSLIMK